MKKFLLLLSFVLTSIISTSQVRVVFFKDIPPIHAQSIAADLYPAIEYVFGDTVISSVQMNMPESYCKKVNAYDANKFIEKIDTTIFTLGVTYRELVDGCKDTIGVLGLSYYNTAMVSGYLLGYTSRIVKTALHELGHVYGLDHCKSKGCYMEEGGQDDVLKIIDEENGFCDICKNFLKLKKLKIMVEEVKKTRMLNVQSEYRLAGMSLIWSVDMATNNIPENREDWNLINTEVTKDGENIYEVTSIEKVLGRKTLELHLKEK